MLNCCFMQGAHLSTPQRPLTPDYTSSNPPSPQTPVSSTSWGTDWFIDRAFVRASTKIGTKTQPTPKSDCPDSSPDPWVRRHVQKPETEMHFERLMKVLLIVVVCGHQAFPLEWLYLTIVRQLIQFCITKVKVDADRERLTGCCKSLTFDGGLSFDVTTFDWFETIKIGVWTYFLWGFDILDFLDFSEGNWDMPEALIQRERFDRDVGETSKMLFFDFLKITYFDFYNILICRVTDWIQFQIELIVSSKYTS